MNKSLLVFVVLLTTVTGCLAQPEATNPSLDTSLFLDGALAESITTEDCTLSGGTETTCYRITVTGTPTSHDVGPFCPQTITDTAEAGGLWIDSGQVYDIDGEFIVNLPTFYNDANWKLYDADGNVNVIDTAEGFQIAARPDVTKEYYNHCVEGRMEWLNDEATVTATLLIPTTPVPSENPGNPTGEHNDLGLTLDGVMISGSAALDAILAAYTLAAFDDCGGHINPALGYHIHGAQGCSEVGDVTEDGETPMFGYAIDGYAIHSPLDESAKTTANLDECNGHTTDELGYHYHASGLENNGILSCLMGEYVVAERGGPPGGLRPQGGAGGAGGAGGQGRAGGPPNFAGAAETLGITEEELRAAIGGPPPNFEAASATLGLSIEVLQAALFPSN